MVQKTSIVLEKTKLNEETENCTKFLYFDIDVPFWTSFKVGSSVNFHLTYSIPPLTTLYGLIANALGLEQDDYSLRDDISFGLKVIHDGEIIEDYLNILKFDNVSNEKLIEKIELEKLKENKELIDQCVDDIYNKKLKGLKEFIRVDKPAIKKVLVDTINEDKLPSQLWAYQFLNNVKRTQVIRERIIKPKYIVYIKTKNSDLLKDIKDSLENPSRPIYLGQSDDIAIIENVSRIMDENEIKKGETDFVNSVVPFHASGCEVILLPIKFVQRKKDKYEKVQLGFSHSPSGNIKLSKKEKHYLIDNGYIVFEDFKKN
ncbi:MAG: hypothetical protein CVT89_00515 [Candidatus Altiarchaeales archaeon HGW-Altiarchaeales-2]|nr:MAG: hypothetical protein CVT89_00515 [Candidatus Altiarchaeales archaeon HGW-Altiarchaeales-2]